MDLGYDGAEYAHFTFDPALPESAVVEAQLADEEWHAVEMTDPTEGRILLRGPSSTETAGVLIGKRCAVRVRVTEDPEQIIRPAGWINLV